MGSAKIIYGFLSFGISILAALVTLLGLLMLFVLPPATYLFKRVIYIDWISLIITLIGLFFYYLQWRIFTAKIVNAALIINLITFFLDIYLLWGLYISI